MPMERLDSKIAHVLAKLDKQALEKEDQNNFQREMMRP
jgi:hypothetical protein